MLAAVEQQALTQASWAGYLHPPGNRLLPPLISFASGCYMPLCSTVQTRRPYLGSQWSHMGTHLACCMSAKHMSGLLHYPIT